MDVSFNRKTNDWGRADLNDLEKMRYSYHASMVAGLIAHVLMKNKKKNQRTPRLKAYRILDNRYVLLYSSCARTEGKKQWKVL